MRLHGSMRRIAFLVTTIVVFAACSRSPYPPPPASRIETVADTLHGVVFEDDYRWLEDQASAETRAWITAQDVYAEAIVDSSAVRDHLRTRLRELMDVPEVGPVRKAGGYEYFTMRRSGEEAERVYRRPVPAAGDSSKPALTGNYEIVLDPTTFDAEYRTILEVMNFSPDGRTMMYAVRNGGQDEVEIRFRDLKTGQDLEDRLPLALYGGVDFDADGKGFTYVHRSREDGPRLKRHIFGRNASLDEVLYGDGLPPTDFLSADRVEGGRLRILGVQHGWASNDVYLQDVRTGAVRTMIADSQAHVATRWNEGRVWILTDLGAPRYRLAVADPAQPGPGHWTTVLPEADDVLESYTFIDGKIYATYLHDVGDRIRIFAMEGTPAGELEVPSGMTANIRAGGKGRALLTLSGHLLPATTWEVDLASGSRTLADSSSVPFDPAGFSVDQVWFTSKDGTRAPMYVVHRDSIALDGSHPTILTGYGGFDLALKPGFSTTTAAWIEMGGVWAVATLRGGSEFGETWHQEGMLENKQHVFDDFIAASEQLIHSSYTSADHLGISGGSNGGLLVASAMTQRPDLYRAVLCTYPDLDMVRFPAFSRINNAPALLEYGDARIPSQFEAIRQYSPYQNVRDGVRYPAVMLATGDLDTRVPPLQARRMTARLQAASSSGRPVILWYDSRGGHAAGRGRPLSLRVEDTARELAFLAGQLGLGPTN
jgi:prolyl oligopeptidase